MIGSSKDCGGWRVAEERTRLSRVLRLTTKMRSFLSRSVRGEVAILEFITRMTLFVCLQFGVSAANAADARQAFRPGDVAQAQFVAPEFGPPQHAAFQVDTVEDTRLGGYLVGSEGLCHGRFRVEARWQGDELVIQSPSRFGTIAARLRSAGGRTLKGPFTVAGRQGEMTLRRVGPD